MNSVPHPDSALAAAQKLASAGGKARAAQLSAQERTDIARTAARARWNSTAHPKRPYFTLGDLLQLEGAWFDCPLVVINSCGERLTVTVVCAESDHTGKRILILRHDSPRVIGLPLS